MPRSGHHVASQQYTTMSDTVDIHVLGGTLKSERVKPLIAIQNHIKIPHTTTISESESGMSTIWASLNHNFSLTYVPANPSLYSGNPPKAAYRGLVSCLAKESV